MRKWLLLAVLFSTMILSACSLLEGANQTLQYTGQANGYLNELSAFAEQAPQMIKDAATDPEIKQKLESRLLELKTNIQTFNVLEPPTIAKDLHEQFVTQNNLLLDEINQALATGHLALDQLQSSRIFSTINEINSLRNRIESLGL